MNQLDLMYESQEEVDPQLNATIVIVDDEPTTMEVVKVFLEEAGYHNFILIENSSEAMEVLEQQRPDLLLLDLIMPEVSGFNLLKAVREHPNLKHLPVIILTSSSNNQDKLSALDLGATDFLAKPVDPSELRLRVRNTLAAKAYTDHLAFYDPVTRLPNRHQFMECLEKGLASAWHHNEKLALLSIELDQFKKISDTLGILTGDEVLRQITGRFKNIVKGIDMLGPFDVNEYAPANLFHVDGGEFVLLMQNVPSEHEAAMIAVRLLESIRSMLLVEGTEVYMTASIGIAIYPTENGDSLTMLQMASTAKDFVKSNGGDSFQFSSHQINTQYQRRINLESMLRKALDRNELRLYYQPQLNIHTNRIVGVEALLRWQVDEATMISPDEFIGIAEETQLIIPIGEWVLSEACRQLAAWQRAGKEPIRMSVNLSPVQFENSEMPAAFKRIIDNSGIDAKLLTLEITENMLMENAERKIEALNRLKALGVKLAIDDFGTGYSCLSYLKRLPLDELKIDRSFFRDFFENTKSRALVATMIYLSRSLNMLTTAEGVETEEQLRFLVEGACDLYQGYLYSPPVPPESLYEMLPPAE